MSDKEYIYNSLKNKGIIINPQYASVFDSHINVLMERLANNACVNYDDCSFMNEIPSSCIKEAHEILDPLFRKYNLDINETEIGLFAIYIKLSEREEK